jgi:hypothetical protein
MIDRSKGGRVDEAAGGGYSIGESKLIRSPL